MVKGKFFLMCIALVLCVVCTVQGESIDVNNFSFEWMADGSYVDEKTGSMDDVNGWESYFPPGLSTWIGVDCLECEGAPELNDEYWTTDGNIAVYGQNVGTGTYQVFDHIIEEGQQFMVTFDALSWDLGDAITPRFFYVEEGVGEDPCLGLDDVNLYNNEMASERIPIEPQVWGLWLWITDLTLVHTVLPGDDCIGNRLGVMFEFPETEDELRWRWGGLDNIRLGWVLATTAYNPIPKNGAINVELDATLSWVPGIYADSEDGHDVYFGTSLEEVNEADDTDTTGIYKDRQSETTYDPNIVFEIARTYYWRIDEFNDTTAGYWKGKVWSFKVNDGTAFNPIPKDGAKMVPVDVNLGWVPGIAVVTHDVYFGTSLDDVNDADDSDTSGIYRDSHDVNYYTPQEFPTDELILGQNYYWRVDEVNDANLWRGKVWTFRAADYHLLDDFERFGDTTVLRKVWHDGWDTGISGSEVTQDTETVRDKRSMKFDYANWLDYDYFSEVVAETFPGSGSPGDYLLYGPDWTANRAESLALWFYGKKDNAASEYDQMYVALDDGISEPVKVQYYGNPNDVRLERWQEWNIGLDEFDGVNLEEVKYLYIGFGIEDGGVNGGEGSVWFDDVRLYPRRCVPKKAYVTGSFGDLNADCVTDYNDIYAMGRDWLLTGYMVTSITPPTANRWYMLDDGSGTTVENIGSDDANNGTFADDPCAPEWQDATSPTDDYSLYFDASDTGKDPNGDSVFIPNFHTGTNNLTITAWVKGDASESVDVFQTGGAGIVWARDTNTNNGTGFCYGWNEDWKDNNELMYCWDELYWDWHTGLLVPENVWTFVAVVVDPGVGTVYMKPSNGELSYASNPGPHHVIVDTGEFLSKLGDDLNGDGMTGNCFWGWMSDVRIYRDALSPGEISSLAGNYGISVPDYFKTLEKWRADADKDDKVDLADYAVLADYWLEEVLFPMP